MGSDVVAASFEGETGVRCVTPAAARPGAAAVQLIDSDAVLVTSVAFEYQPQVYVSSVAPVVGVLAGGTLVSVSGWGFSERAALLGYTGVRFNLTRVPVVWVSTRELHCVAPEHPAGLVSVEVTQNDQQYSSSLTFEYRDVVAHSIHPRSGPVLGGTMVVVRGGSFDAPGSLGLFCSFMGSDVVAASFEGETG